MKCELVRNLMSSYIDKDLNSLEKAEFEKHIAQCPLCREEYELLLEVVTECNDIEEAELPLNFRETLHQKLMQEKATKSGKLAAFIKKQGWKAAAGLTAAVLIFAFALGNPAVHVQQRNASHNIAAGQAPTNKSAFTKGNATEALKDKAISPIIVTTTTSDTAQTATQYGLVIGSAGSPQPPAAPQGTERTQRVNEQPIGRKVIRNGNINIKVTALDQKIGEIQKIAETSGGYVESSQSENMIVQTGPDVARGQQVLERDTRFANIVIRIPSESFDSIFGNLKAMGKVINENVSGTDITTEYRDTYTRVANLQIQEQRLQELMSKANTVDETLRIENELNRIRTDIDTMTGALRSWDQQVALSTVSIQLTEVKADELKTVDMPNIWGKAYNGFIGAINNIVYGSENLFIYLISGLPYLVLLGIAVAVVIILLRRRKRRKEIGGL